VTVCHQFYSLHWLSIRQRVTFKITLLVWKCVHGAAPVLSAELLCPGRRRPRVSTATVCVYSMYSVTEGEDVNGTAKSCVPWSDRQFGTVCHQLCGTALCLSLTAFKGRLKTCLFGRWYTIAKTIRRCVLWSWRRPWMFRLTNFYCVFVRLEIEWSDSQLSVLVGYLELAL